MSSAPPVTCLVRPLLFSRTGTGRRKIKMLRLCVLVPACCFVVVISAAALNEQGSYQAPGVGGGSEGYNSADGGDYRNVLGDPRGPGGAGLPSPNVPFPTNSDNTGVPYNVELGPAPAFGQGGFNENPSAPQPFSPSLPSPQPRDQPLPAYSTSGAANSASFGPGLPSNGQLPTDLGGDGGYQPSAVNAHAGSQGDAPVFPGGIEGGLGAKTNRVVYGDDGIHASGGGGGTGGKVSFDGGNGNVGDIFGNADNFASVDQAGFKTNLFPSGVNDDKLFGDNSGAFPRTLNGGDVNLSFDADTAGGSQYGNSAANQQAFNDVNDLASNAARLYTDGNQAFVHSANTAAKPPTFPSPNPPSAGSQGDRNTVYSDPAFPSAGNVNLQQGDKAFSTSQGDSAYTSASQRSPLKVITSSAARDDVYDSGLKSTGGSVSLNEDQINKLGDGSDLVNDLLGGNDVYDFNVGDSFNVNNAFKSQSPGGNSPFGKDLKSGPVKYTGISNAGIGTGSNNGATVPYNDNLGGQQEDDTVSKELDARAATLGFSGYSDGSAGVNSIDSQGGVRNAYSGNSGLRGNSGVPSFPRSGSASLNPTSPFNINTDVRGGYKPTSGLTGSGQGKDAVFGNTGRFNAPSALGDRRAGASLSSPYGNTNPLSGNTLSGNSLGGRHSGLSGNPLGGSGLGSNDKNNLNVLSNPKASLPQNGQSAFPNAFSSGSSKRSGLNAGADLFAKQPFSSGSNNNPLNLGANRNVLGSQRLGSDFSRRNTGSGSGGYQQDVGSVFKQNGGLTSSNSLGQQNNHGFGNAAALSGLNYGQNGLSSGNQFSTLGSSEGKGLGSLVSRSSSGKSSFSSSSSSSGLGSGGRVGEGAFSSGGVGVGNSLTGVSFGGLGQLGRTGSAVTGSSRKVYDSGVVGTSNSVSGGGSKSYSTGSGSSQSSGSSFDNSDFGDGRNGAHYGAGLADSNSYEGLAGNASG